MVISGPNLDLPTMRDLLILYLNDLDTPSGGAAGDSGPDNDETTETTTDSNVDDIASLPPPVQRAPSEQLAAALQLRRATLEHSAAQRKHGAADPSQTTATSDATEPAPPSAAHAESVGANSVAPITRRMTLGTGQGSSVFKAVPNVAVQAAEKKNEGHNEDDADAGADGDGGEHEDGEDGEDDDDDEPTAELLLLSALKRFSWQCAFPSDIVESVVYAGTSTRCDVCITFPLPPIFDADDKISTAFVGSILDSRLFEILRLRMGGVYTVSVTADHHIHPQLQGMLFCERFCLSLAAQCRVILSKCISIWDT